MFILLFYGHCYVSGHAAYLFCFQGNLFCMVMSQYRIMIWLFLKHCSLSVILWTLCNVKQLLDHSQVITESVLSSPTNYSIKPRCPTITSHGRCSKARLNKNSERYVNQRKVISQGALKKLDGTNKASVNGDQRAPCLLCRHSRSTSIGC